MWVPCLQRAHVLADRAGPFIASGEQVVASGEVAPAACIPRPDGVAVTAMRTIAWERGKIELRLPGIGKTTARYRLADQPRPAQRPLLHAPYDDGFSSYRLPASILPCVRPTGEPIDPGAAFSGQNLDWKSLQILVPASHAPLPLRATSQGGLVSIPGVWISGVGQEQALLLERQVGAIPGIYVRDDEGVVLPSHGVTWWLHRLPRIVLEPRDEIADNTAGDLSMAHLLNEFVHRFSDDARPMAQVRIATGYLYTTGLVRMLDLLHNPQITVHLLFSGRTDRMTARMLTSVFGQVLSAGVDADETGTLWGRCREAAAAGRLRVRVYTDAFLHAKLFLGFDKIDKLKKLSGGYAVIGSSNVSAAGMHDGGNLELDVSIDGKDRVTALYHWFERRWEEASDPDPTLLEVLDETRPLPPPVFDIPGLDAVYRAGLSGALAAPEDHLQLLAQIYDDRIQRLRLPSDLAFPSSDRREIHPTPEQHDGVLALAARLESTRIAFLADSVGLGKTITALGLAAYMRRHDRAERVALIAPQKLWDQWHADAQKVDLRGRVFEPINRHQLERLDSEEARRALEPYDLILVEEAHESLRNRANKLWQHLRLHLARNVHCRILLISATPWNNRREDIFNFLLLAWNDGSRLAEQYPALKVRPLVEHMAAFRVAPYGHVPAAAAVKRFENLGRETYGPVFGEVFVQRTRSRLESKFGRKLDFPEREVHPHITPPAEEHDAFLADLAQALTELSIPYREPFRAILRAVAADDQDEGAGNLHRSFVLQLYKRAESSLFALAVSLRTVRDRLGEFRADMTALRDHPAPDAALSAYLRCDVLALDTGGDDEGPWPDPEMLTAAEKARLTRLRGVIDSLDAEGARALLQRLIDVQIDPDIATIDRLTARLCFALDERAPKDLLLAKIMREAYARGYKPIAVAGYADTATRTFLRLLDLIPDARIALALGGGQAWLRRPERQGRNPVTAEEWAAALDRPAEERRAMLLDRAGRAERIRRDDALAAFAPRARGTSPLLLATTGGEIDILVGSEAISVGQNLQDSTCLVQLDLPWNPMVIEQRIGRIDRRGGGRPDPRNPAGRKIVDVHYCWSDMAIEREVELRDRLVGKAQRAIEDTNFDEVLLYEVLEHVQRARASQAAREEAAAAVLLRRQRTLAEARAHGADVTQGALAELDGLRRLGRWMADRRELPRALPVVAAGMFSEEIAGGWIVTLELSPLDGRGQPIPGGPLVDTLLLEEDEEPLPDLDRAVEMLVGSELPASHPGERRRDWITTLFRLQARLRAFADRKKDEHNADRNERLAAQTAPAARRAPSEHLAVLMIKARDALEKELRRYPQGSPQLAPLQEDRERWKLLLREALDPRRLPEILGERTEPTVELALLTIRDFPARLLGPDFEQIFEVLCVPLQSPQGGAVTLPLLTDLDNLWAGVHLRVIAATRVVPVSMGDS
jgi:superfamily II DNA or RNA helicase